MSSVPQVAENMKRILEERANELARETGCIQRVRKFSGADLLQTLAFGWQQHPDASLERLASTAELGEGSVTDTAVDKRFTPQCAAFLHAVAEEMSSVVVQAAHDVPISLLLYWSALVPVLLMSDFPASPNNSRPTAPVRRVPAGATARASRLSSKASTSTSNG